MLYLHTDRSTSCSLGPMVKAISSQMESLCNTCRQPTLSAKCVHRYRLTLSYCLHWYMRRAPTEVSPNLVLLTMTCHVIMLGLEAAESAAACTVAQARAQAVEYSPETAAQQDLSLPARRA